MYEIYSVNVETHAVKLYGRAASVCEAEQSLQKFSKEFIRIEQGERFAEKPFFDEHNPDRNGYYLVHGTSKEIYVHEQRDIKKAGLLWETQKKEQRRVMIFSFCEASSEKSETTLKCSKAPETPPEQQGVREAMLDELRKVLAKRQEA